MPEMDSFAVGLLRGFYGKSSNDTFKRLGNLGALSVKIGLQSMRFKGCFEGRFLWWAFDGFKATQGFLLSRAVVGISKGGKKVAGRIRGRIVVAGSEICLMGVVLRVFAGEK